MDDKEFVKNNWPIAAFIAFVLAVKFGAVPSVTPDVKPPTLDLRPAFAHADKAQARQDCYAFGGINGVFAACINVSDEDGKKIFPTAKSLDIHRTAIRKSATGGWSFVDKYPALGPVVKAHFEAKVGTDAGNLTDEQRAKWVAAAKELSDAAMWASTRL